MLKNWSDTIIDYYENLACPELPAGYECMNPYRSPEVQSVVSAFFNRFYADLEPRTLLLGINPGRFGAGITGISFTDPIILTDSLGIEHNFDRRPELSSRFVHEMIAAFGGIEHFTKKFFITSVYPLGFLKDGKNINYYEIEGWRNHLLPLIENELAEHKTWNINRKVGICIGKGDNLKHLNKINDKLGLFDQIVTVPHPRWVMQYRLKRKLEFIDEYVKLLSSI